MISVSKRARGWVGGLQDHFRCHLDHAQTVGRKSMCVREEGRRGRGSS